jgi:rhodanese-related sulfurtransferase
VAARPWRRALQEMGYLKVQSIAGSFDAWAAADKPNLPSFA